MCVRIRVHAYVMFVCERKGKEMLYLTMHSTHFIYGYMASVIW